MAVGQQKPTLLALNSPGQMSDPGGGGFQPHMGFSFISEDSRTAPWEPLGLHG